MQPEISHRCSSCGAAVREPAMFCPECGKAMTRTAKDTSTEEPRTSRKPAVRDEFIAATEHSSSVIHTDEPGSSPGARRRTRETLHRASTAARGAIGENVKRVEKIHHVSTAMFEEAHYDPSLRFVLVALGLFVVFVVLLVLSKVMG